jgi:hypothetical protein
LRDHYEAGSSPAVLAGAVMTARISPFVFLVVSHLCSAQVAIPVVLPEAPSVVAAVVSTPTVSTPKLKVHSFFDAQNIALFSIGAAFVASDSITTQRMVGTGRFEEQDPIARPFVNNGWKGQTLISAIGFGGSVGLSYAFHKFGHHKMERWVGLSLIGIELAATVHNSRLELITQ